MSNDPNQALVEENLRLRRALTAVLFWFPTAKDMRRVAQEALDISVAKEDEEPSVVTPWGDRDPDDDEPEWQPHRTYSDPLP